MPARSSPTSTAQAPGVRRPPIRVTESRVDGPRRMRKIPAIAAAPKPAAACTSTITPDAVPPSAAPPTAQASMMDRQGAHRGRARLLMAGRCRTGKLRAELPRYSVFGLRTRSPSSGSDLLFAFVLDGAGELEILVFRVRISQREAQAGQALAEVGGEGVVGLGRRRFLLLAAAVGRLRQPARSPRLGALGPVVARDVRLIAQVAILQGERLRGPAQPLELAVFLFHA